MHATAGGSVLVVGASGILAPAVAALLRRGVGVTGITRSRAAPPGAASLTVDARDAASVHRATAGRMWDAALVYAPAVSPESLEAIRAAVRGRAVLVRTSREAVARVDEVPADTLQLGWHDEPDGSTRWHSPDEVSTAALAVLDDGVGRMLGTLTPPERRP